MTEGTGSRAEGQLVGGGRYRVEAVLGSGAMGAVYRVRQLSLNRTVALKLLKREAVSGLSNLKRFVQEARLLTRLSHPNVVPVYDVDLEAEEPYIAMELVNGPSLESILEEPGRFGRPDPLTVARDLASGLAYVHGEGVLHRDIKPANILVKDGIRAMLADFGLARGADSAALTTAGFVVGTPAYLAPEQFTMGVSNEKTDLYQLGLVLYEVITGKLLIQTGGAEMQKVLAARMEGRLPDLLKIAPEAPRELSRAVMRCLAKDPALRFASAQELADALTQVPESSDRVQVKGTAITPVKSSARRPSAATPLQTQAQRARAAAPAQTRWHPGWIGGLGLLCGLVALAVFLASGRAASPPAAAPSPVPDARVEVTEWSFEPSSRQLAVRARLSRPVAAGWRLATGPSVPTSGSSSSWIEATFPHEPDRPFSLAILRSDGGRELVLTEAVLLRSLRSEAERLTRILRGFWSKNGLTDQSFVNALRKPASGGLREVLDSQFQILEPVRKFLPLAPLYFDSRALPAVERLALYKLLAPLILTDCVAKQTLQPFPFGQPLASSLGATYAQISKPDVSDSKNYLAVERVVLREDGVASKATRLQFPPLAHPSPKRVLVGARFKFDSKDVLKLQVGDVPLYFTQTPERYYLERFLIKSVASFRNGKLIRNDVDLATKVNCEFAAHGIDPEALGSFTGQVLVDAIHLGSPTPLDNDRVWAVCVSLFE